MTSEGRETPPFGTNAMFERPRTCAVFRFLLRFLRVARFTPFVLCTRFAPRCDLVVTREF